MRFRDFVTDKYAFVIRDFVDHSLTERLCTRPFLTVDEKRWIAFQLLSAINQLHSSTNADSTVSFSGRNYVNRSFYRFIQFHFAFSFSHSRVAMATSSRRMYSLRPGAGCSWSIRRPSSLPGCRLTTRASSLTFLIVPDVGSAIWRLNASSTLCSPVLVVARLLVLLPGPLTSKAMLIL